MKKKKFMKMFSSSFDSNTDNFEHSSDVSYNYRLDDDVSPRWDEMRKMRRDMEKKRARRAKQTMHGVAFA